MTRFCKDSVDEQLSALPKPNAVVDAIDTISAKLKLCCGMVSEKHYLPHLQHGRIDPPELRVTTLSKTHTDALARVMRKRVHEAWTCRLPVCSTP